MAVFLRLMLQLSWVPTMTAVDRDMNYERGGNSRMPMPMDRSYDRGMSRADSVQRTIDVLETMLDTAETEKERRAIMNHINDLKR